MVPPDPLPEVARERAHAPFRRPRTTHGPPRRYCAGSDKGRPGSGEANRDFLLRKLPDAPANGRSARLVSVVSIAAPDGQLQTFESTLDGVVADGPRGVEGLGYESTFELNDGKTIAELLPEQQNEVRPRGLAVQQARPFLDELVGERHGRAYTRPHVSHRPRRR
jgi:inosine/xanthosine triphosphate pyrophosphatase family protein